jgi:signal transduction histidine kinase
MRERIFEPFVQLNSPVMSHVGGTGLGLAISRDLARLMGGTLGVEPRDGGGSVFCLILPAAPADDGDSREVVTMSF